MNTPYDAVTYPNRCHPQTHPERLVVLAELFGLSPARPEACRVLELGCGDGSNLLPQAFAQPGSRFVGMDLAPTLIAAARQSAASLGARNVEFYEADLAAFPTTGEPFDYIVAHGVYSWVPPRARDALLAVCRGRLAPQGVAFVSYNCLPGCHIRRMARDIMRFHVRAVADPVERVRQAVAVCGFIANSIEKPDTYRQVFKEQMEQVERYSSGHLFHDDLAEINDPCYFHEFIAHAAGHGLQFLAEADFFEMQDHAFTPEAREVLGRMEDSRLTREQYIDFIKCRRFRQTLLCRHEATVQHPPEAAPIERFHIASEAKAEPAGDSGPNGAVERFVDPRGGALEVDYPLAKEALRVLRERWPATCAFGELVSIAASRLPAMDSAALTQARDNLAAILLEAYRAGVVELRGTPLACAAELSARPAVWRFARWQAAHQHVVTTLRGDSLRLENDHARHLLQLLDGSRNLEDIRRAIEEGPTPPPSPGEPPATRLEDRVLELARLALLEA